MTRNTQSRNFRRQRHDRRPCQWREPRIEALEQRMLLSVTAIANGLEYLVAADDFSPHVMLHAPLPSRDEVPPGGPDSAPVFNGFPPVILGEDNNDYFLDLTTAFQNAGGGTTGLQFQVMNTTHTELFDSVTIEGNRLRLDLRRHAFGESSIRIRATDATAQFVEATLPVTILPVNDRPMTSGFPNLVLAPNQTRIEVDLFAAFSDIEDEPHELTYSITQNTRPDLFQSITIDPVRGRLLIQVRPGIQGTSTLTLRATDTEGAYVEMTNRGTQFGVHSAIANMPPLVAQLGLPQLNTVTDWWLFEQVDGTYIYDHIDEDQLRFYLNSSYFDPTRPTVIAIESPYFDNSPSGRELRADVMRIFWEEAPEATHVGFYSYLPARDWHASVNWRRAQEDVQRGFFTWYAGNYEQFRQENLNWQQDNSLWRTATLADGSVVSDYITAVYPSLYTHYRDTSSYAGSLIVDVAFSGKSGRFSVADVPFANGLEVRFNPSHLDMLPAGFSPFVSYYVVNANGSTFQLSATPGGAPLAINSLDAGTHYLEIVGPRTSTVYDPDVVYWRYYIEEHIGEARKFNVPVSLYLSPSFTGMGGQYLDEPFFRMQLDLAYELADSITIFDPGIGNMAAPENLGWYRAISDFLQYIRTPTQFQITVNTSDLPSDESRMRGDFGPRLDKFTGTAFAAAASRQWDTDQLFRPGPEPPLGTTMTESNLVIPPILVGHSRELRLTAFNVPSYWSWNMSSDVGLHFDEDDDKSDDVLDESAASSVERLAKFAANGYSEHEGRTTDRSTDVWRWMLGKRRSDGRQANQAECPTDSEREADAYVSVQPSYYASFRFDAAGNAPIHGNWWRGKPLETV